MVWAPGIEEDGGDIAFEREPEIRLTPEQARAIEEGAKFCATHSEVFPPQRNALSATTMNCSLRILSWERVRR